MADTTRSNNGTMRLELLRRGEVVRTWHVPGSRARLGASEDCDVCLRGVPGLRPVHATLLASEGGITLTPADGARLSLNGVETDCAIPGPTDVISLGRVDLRVLWEPPPRPQPDSARNHESTTPPVLVVEAPGGRRRTLTLTPGQLTIGTHSQHIRLRFPGITSDHALLSFDGEALHVTARAGRVVRNGRGVDQAPLREGDLIEIGVVRIYLEPTTAQPTPLSLHRAQPEPDEDTSDPATVLMPGWRAQFDDLPPPTVIAKPPAAPTLLHGGRAAGAPARPIPHTTTRDGRTSGAPLALLSAKPPRPPTDAPRAPHVAARVLHHGADRTVTASEVKPDTPYDSGPLHCHVAGTSLMVETRVSARRGTAHVGPGALRLAEGEVLWLDEGDCAWRVDVYRPTLRRRVPAVRWTLMLASAAAVAWVIRGLIVV